MPIATSAHLLAYWHQALSAQFGIVLRTSNPTALQNRLYAVRKADGDPALQNVSILRTAAIPEHLYLIRKELTNAKRPDRPTRSNLPNGSGSDPDRR